MSHIFSRTFRVDWSDANANGEVHLPTYFRYLIETAWSWGAAVGLGIEDSRKLGLVWVVRETQITLLRPLLPDDEFELTIWLAHWRRVHGTRFFEIVHKASGEVVAQGAQEVVTLNPANMRPKAVPDTIVERLTAPAPRTVPHRPFPTLAMEGNRTIQRRRTVEWQDLDSLEHVNNTRYVAFAEDAVVAALAGFGWGPAELKAQGLALRNRHVHIQYLVPAVWGETLELTMALTALGPEGGEWAVAIARASDHTPVARCVIAWEIFQTAEGSIRPMPEALYRQLTAYVAVPATAPQA